MLLFFVCVLLIVCTHHIHLFFFVCSRLPFGWCVFALLSFFLFFLIFLLLNHTHFDT